MLNSQRPRFAHDLERNLHFRGSEDVPRITHKIIKDLSICKTAFHVSFPADSFIARKMSPLTRTSHQRKGSSSLSLAQHSLCLPDTSLGLPESFGITNKSFQTRLSTKEINTQICWSCKSLLENYRLNSDRVSSLPPLSHTIPLGLPFEELEDDEAVPNAGVALAK